MRRRRVATWKTWLGAALVVCLLLAESFAVTHPLDRAAHPDGQPCAACVSIASLGAGAVAAETVLALDAAAPPIVETVALVPVANVPVRRYARGPPSVSFTS